MSILGRYPSYIATILDKTIEITTRKKSKHGNLFFLSWQEPRKGLYNAVTYEPNATSAGTREVQRRLYSPPKRGACSLLSGPLVRTIEEKLAFCRGRNYVL
jgi:hypothetical protein